MIDALGEWVSQPAYFCACGGESAGTTGARNSSISPRGPFCVRYGAVSLGILKDRELRASCADVLTQTCLAADPRFVCNGDRVDHNDALTAIIEDVFADCTARDVTGLLDRAGIASARLRTPCEVISHKQLRARGRWRRVGTPGGEIEALLPAGYVVGHESVMADGPALGRHNSVSRADFRAKASMRQQARPGSWGRK